jgi:hypothetical protein
LASLCFQVIAPPAPHRAGLLNSVALLMPCSSTWIYLFGAAFAIIYAASLPKSKKNRQPLSNIFNPDINRPCWVFLGRRSSVETLRHYMTASPAPAGRLPVGVPYPGGGCRSVCPLSARCGLPGVVFPAPARQRHLAPFLCVCWRLASCPGYNAAIFGLVTTAQFCAIV